ncbi:MAG: 50S ribosomal protein L4 [Parcubacteria group bacterium]|nr:50S ribosomal protein L4 [Parcubacteria group bacterium]
MKAKVFNVQGQEVREMDLPSDIFDVTLSKDTLIHAVRVQLANKRQVLAHTKTRGEVRGGGKKPWKQKGTGRARHGSIRSPLWVGGGIVFGPRKDRNFSLKINKKQKSKALCMGLSDKATHQQLIVMDEWKIDAIKTKNMAKILQSLPVKQDSALILFEKSDEKLIKSLRNIPNIMSMHAKCLNIIDLLKYKYLVLPVAALDLLPVKMKKQ